MSNAKNTAESLKAMIDASRQLDSTMRKSAATFLRGFAQRQQEFEEHKRQLEDDIKRGSKLSKGRIPF